MKKTKCPKCGFKFKPINEFLDRAKETLTESQFNSLQENIYVTQKNSDNKVFCCPKCSYGPMNVNEYQ